MTYDDSVACEQHNMTLTQFLITNFIILLVYNFANKMRVALSHNDLLTECSFCKCTEHWDMDIRKKQKTKGQFTLTLKYHLYL